MRLDKTMAVRLRKRTKYTSRGTTTVQSDSSEIAQIWLNGTRPQGSTEHSLNNTLWSSLPLVQFFSFFSFCALVYKYNTINMHIPHLPGVKLAL